MGAGRVRTSKRKKTEDVLLEVNLKNRPELPEQKRKGL